MKNQKDVFYIFIFNEENNFISPWFNFLAGINVIITFLNGWRGQVLHIFWGHLYYLSSDNLIYYFVLNISKNAITELIKLVVRNNLQCTTKNLENYNIAKTVSCNTNCTNHCERIFQSTLRELKFQPIGTPLENSSTNILIGRSLGRRWILNK